MQLKLSSEGRYALRTLIYLALVGEQATADRVSAEAHIPRRLLAPILAKLSHAVPAPLGGDVPRCGGFLELPRSGDLRLPHKLAAGLILAAESTRPQAPLELAVLVAALVVVALAAWHLQAAFRATPANFPVLHAPAPDPTPADTLRTGYRKSKEARH